MQWLFQGKYSLLRFLFFLFLPLFSPLYMYPKIWVAPFSLFFFFFLLALKNMVYPVFCFLLFTCSQKCGLPCFLLPFLYFSFFLLTSTKNMFFFAYYVFFIIKKIKHGLARFLFFPPCLHSKILLVLFFSFSFLLLFFLALKNVACPTFSLSSFYAKKYGFSLSHFAVFY